MVHSTQCRRVVIAAAVGVVALAARPAPAVDGESASAPAYDPTEAYRPRRVAGWPVLVNERLLAEPDLCGQTLQLLEGQLQQVERVVPPAAVDRLRQVNIWVELDDSHHPCMCYHPDARWLREHGMNPDKAGGVEVANARTFLEWTKAQPWMVLHELAHAHHHQFIADGYDNRPLADALKAAQTRGDYERVRHVDGRTVRHYAVTNPAEYFAEASEAYFGKNDFYPFVRSELREHDRQAYDLIEELWDVEPQSAINAGE